jgi:WD40 repeat protein
MFLINGKNSCLVPESVPIFSLLSIGENLKFKKFFDELNQIKNSKFKFKKNYFQKAKCTFLDSEEELSESFHEEIESKIIYTENKRFGTLINFYIINSCKKKHFKAILHHQNHIYSNIICSSISPEMSTIKNFYFQNLIALGSEMGEIEIYQPHDKESNESLITLKSIKNLGKIEKKKKLLNRILFQKKSINCLSWNKKKLNILLSLSKENILKCWDIEKGKIINLLKNPQGIEIKAKTFCEWQPQNEFQYFFSSDDLNINFADVRCKEILKTIKTERIIHSIKWLNNPNLIIVFEKEGNVSIIDLRKNSTMQKFNNFNYKANTISEIEISSISPDNSKILLIDKKGNYEELIMKDSKKIKKRFIGKIQKNLKKVTWFPGNSGRKKNSSLLIGINKNYKISLFSLKKK